MALTTVNATLFQGTQLTTSLVTLYTSTNKKTIIDKLTVVNTTGGAVTFTANLIASGGSASDANTMVITRSVAAGAADLCPELIGHTMEAGDFLQMKASAGSSLSARASGRQVTGSP